MPKIGSFLTEKLKLNPHPDKIYIKTLVSSIDFLGWVNFPNHRVLRTSTKRRMLKALAGLEKDLVALASYRGLPKHGNAYKLRRMIDQEAVV